MNKDEAVALLSKSEAPIVAIILGSGLGLLTEAFTDKKHVKYDEIDGFPQSTVEGHSGQFVTGRLMGVRVIAAQGRFHYYEGYNLKQILSLVDFFHAMRIKELVISNAAGLINTDYHVGEIFGISDCLDFTGQAAAAGELSLCRISEKEQSIMTKAAESIFKKLVFGKYVWTTGPSYETPAEIRYFRSLGGDLVGMSTMPEIIKARSLGMQVYPFSVATNFASGISGNALSHDEVKETAETIKSHFASLISELVNLIGKQNFDI
ncbi:MAG TPA: purine-nucleoside phosphorylase [Candidatus Marinimicrobia bacterium]|nr:purine-nucleoside phosphorylase [Candidatus Neomarinimicrobiota bacterium]